MKYLQKNGRRPQYLDELAEKKETAHAQVERKRIGYVLGEENQMMKD